MFESSVSLTPEQIEWLDLCTTGNWQLNPQTGLVDVDGDFNCSGQGLSDFKGVRFGVVRRDFYCKNNRLTTLEGAPQKVGGHFDCRNNQLTTLEGAPQEVRRDFSCDNNQLTSLEGVPLEISGSNFYYRNNPVSEKTFKRIFGRMQASGSYLEAVESFWSSFPPEDRALLYRPEFEWVIGDERKKFDALRAYQGFKSMI